jgi:hypothetical protein
MEPATVILLMAFATPIVPTRLRAFDELHQIGGMPASDSAATVIRQSELLTVAQVPAPGLRAELSRLDETVREIRAFGSPASGDAEKFLELLPSGFPIPRAAHGEDDVITLFWDMDSFYADLEFRGDGTLSVFARHRGDPKVDRGCEGISLSQAFGSWGYEYLSELAPALSQAA